MYSGSCQVLVSKKKGINDLAYHLDMQIIKVFSWSEVFWLMVLWFYFWFMVLVYYPLYFYFAECHTLCFYLAKDYYWLICWSIFLIYQHKFVFLYFWARVHQILFLNRMILVRQKKNSRVQIGGYLWLKIKWNKGGSSQLGGQLAISQIMVFMILPIKEKSQYLCISLRNRILILLFLHQIMVFWFIMSLINIVFGLGYIDLARNEPLVSTSV